MTLRDAISGIDWAVNIDAALSHGSTLIKIDAAAHRIAVWSRQLEIADHGNPALCFIREMQHSIQHSGTLIALCLYKPSAASSRTLVESCLYYTYFRCHSTELATLVRNPKFFISKSAIVEYHKTHTPSFGERQEALGLVSRLELWYSAISAIVHGQIPGTWNTHTDLSKTKFLEEIHVSALSNLLSAAQIVNDLLFSTITQYLWGSFSPEAKKFLIQGMDDTKRTTLKLDMK